jgi:esterase FrsA
MFTFYAEPKSIVEERFAQFTSLGTPAATIERVIAKIDDLWRDGPGGWAYEWSAEATAHEQRGAYLDASLLHGIGKYPCLGDATHTRAYERQLEAYLVAARDFPCKFERRIVPVDYRGGKTDVAVHILSPRSEPEKAPLLMMLGGIDTWKMDVHNAAMQTGSAVGAHVVLVDMAGVGESKVPMGPDSDVILAGVIKQLRGIGNGKAGVFGFSFGATWAVKLALTDAVDVAVASGPLVDAAFDVGFLSRMPNGMPGIIGNAFRRAEPFASDAELGQAMAPFSMRVQGLFDWRRSSAPLYVFNGDIDPYVPTSDITVFEDRPNTVVKVVAGAPHCAAGKIHELMPSIVEWLRRYLR